MPLMDLPIAGERNEERAVPRCVARGKDTDNGIPLVVCRSWYPLQAPVVTLQRVAKLPVPGGLITRYGFGGVRRETALG